LFQNPKRGKWYADHRPKFSFTKSYIPFINNSSTTNYVNKNGRGRAYVPYAKAPVHKWVQSTRKNVQHGKNNVVRGNTSNNVTKSVATDTEDPDGQRNMLEIITKEIIILLELNGGRIKGPKRVLLQGLMIKRLTLKKNW
jgi:hypothetical protein